MNKKKLIREQLDASLKRFSPLLNVSVPPKGWIRAIRDALGMTARQLAYRLDVAQQAVARIEKEELAGSVTIKTMRRIAECLDCVFVYGFVPRTSLEETVARQAKQVAIQRLAHASQTMSLENQALSRTENDQALSNLVDELIRTLPSTLWNKHD
ncbi:MAG: mobile mystery protein A [Desulfobacterales bacterium]|nr:mobile mystery protein A [Desulfobacterales bacterium]